MGLIEAAHLEALEEAAQAGAEVQSQAMTLQDAVEALRRIRWHREQITRIQAEAETLIAPLRAEIERIEAWAREQIDDRQRRIQFHELRLQAFYRENPPAKGKTLRLPGGSISVRQPPPRWVYHDEASLLERLRALGKAVRTRYEVDKQALKDAVTILPDGTVADAETGEVLPGVVVVEQPPVCKVEVE